MAHTVIQTVQSPPPEGEGANRRDFINIAAGALAADGAAAFIWPLVDQMNPAGDTLALASIEFDLTKVALGQEVTVKWRGAPVAIRHRTPAEIAAAVKDDGASLKDPQPDSARHKPGKAEWLIVVSTCTHLGCVPLFGQGDYKGWFCPCHGSVYDTSGRIRKGPAPTNLVVPEYEFVSDTRIKIG